MKNTNWVLALLIVTLISFSLQAQNGWMISASSSSSSPPPYYIYHTTNGGVTWSLQYTDSMPGGFSSLQFIDVNNGWVVGDSGKILKTTNGGTTWTRITNTGLPASYSTTKCFFFLNADTGWISTSQSSWPNHLILHTTNGGTTWTQQSFPFNGSIFSLNFRDANNGWLSGEQCTQNCTGPDSLYVFSGVLAHSITGGSSWSFQSNSLSTGINIGKIIFTSSTEGWASAGNGQLLHTINAGTNWTIVTPFPNDTVTSMSDPSVTMSWVNPTHGWRISWMGEGFADAHGGVVYKTADGGLTWTRKVLSTAAGDLGMQIQFLDENNGWASVSNLTTNHFTIFRTSDGGNTWNPITPNVGGFFYFAGSGEGILNGYSKLTSLSRISVSPNPAHDALFISFASAASNRKVEIYSMQGVKIYESAGVMQKSSAKINLSKCSKGMYIIKITDGEILQTQKIIVQ